MNSGASPNPNYSVKSIEVIASGSDVLVRHYTLAPGDEIPWHYHNHVTDWYFGFDGHLTIETRAPRGGCDLALGVRYSIPPKVAHRLSNNGTSDCRFLLVQGVGPYDFHKI
ncbi:MAG TPA: cupin domain-containing protein [Alphaproteobacteria bacterium]|nr:cupin domain-containing protein [Alphaproteobacteria bacterium]